MIENQLPLGQIPPGFFGNGTVFQSMGRWRKGNLVRFHEGTIRPIGGWRSLAFSGTAMLGVAQHAISYQLADGTPILAVGTTNGLYIIGSDNIVHDITPGAILPAPYDWHLSIFGTYLIATNSLLGDEDISAINVYYWDGATPTSPAAAVVLGSTALVPRGVYSTFSTPERFLVCLRGEDPTGFPAPVGIATPYSEKRIYVASQETITDFLPTDVNKATFQDFTTGGRFIVGAAARGNSLLWTDVDVWSMTFIGGQFQYSFKREGDNCGIVSKRAYVVLDRGTFWMARGKFFLYDGFARNLPCEVSDAVFSNFNEQRADTVWAVANPRYNEVTWFYPSAGSQVPDRYVTYNFEENHWVNGTLERTAGVQQRYTKDVIDEPIPVWFDNVVGYEHEIGEDRTSQANLESGPIQYQNGDQLIRMQVVMPDDLNVGDVQLRLYTSFGPDGQETLNGPYPLFAQTDIRLTARQFRIRLEEVNQVSWRVGTPHIGVIPVERRGLPTGQPADLIPVSLEIIPSSITLTNAQTYTFQSIVRNAGGQVLDIVPDTWTSDNLTQVPVDNHGTVTANVAVATAHIQAFITSPALSSNIALVTVNGDTVPHSIVITPTAEDLIASSTPVTLTAKVYNAAGQLLTGATINNWLTSDGTKVSVTPSGGQNLTCSIAGLANGTSNITANITSGVPATVTSNISVATVTDPYYTHTFTAPDQFHVSVIGSGVVDRVLYVGGGGSGASVDGTGVGCGGGGAGAVVEHTAVTVVSGDNPVNVGAGGAGVLATSISSVVNGLGGGPTTFRGVTCPGGGGGSGSGVGGALDSASNAAGSGGGGRGDSSAGAAGGAGTAGGHAGGAGDGAGHGGGGGGAGAAGVVLAAGGGVSNDISGVALVYGGGGAGRTAITRTGSNFAAVAGVDGSAGFGDGGSGSTSGFQETPVEEGLAAISGAGGSGVLIVRYKVSTGITATGGTKVLHS